MKAGYIRTYDKRLKIKMNWKKVADFKMYAAQIYTYSPIWYTHLIVKIIKVVFFFRYIICHAQRALYVYLCSCAWMSECIILLSSIGGRRKYVISIFCTKCHCMWTSWTTHAFLHEHNNKTIFNQIKISVTYIICGLNS